MKTLQTNTGRRGDKRGTDEGVKIEIPIARKVRR